MAKAKKIKRQAGDVVAVKLEDGSFSFGVVLEEPLMAFYDYNSRELPELKAIVAKPVLFKVWVMNSAVESGRWEVIGSTSLTPELASTPRFFKQSPLNKRLTVYFKGEETPSTKDECQNLERAAVWDPEHVEDRLRDHYAGVPNQWVESLKIQ